MNLKKENEYLVMDFTMNFLKIVFHLLSLIASFGIISAVFFVVIQNDIAVNIITSVFLLPIEILVAMFIPITLKSSEKGLRNVSFTITLFLIVMVVFSAFLTTVGTSDFWVSSYIENVEKPLKQTETKETRKLSDDIKYYRGKVDEATLSKKKRGTSWYNEAENKDIMEYTPLISLKERALLSLREKIESENKVILSENLEAIEFEKIKSFGFGFFIQLAIIFITICHYYIINGRVEKLPKQEETTVNSGNIEMSDLETDVFGLMSNDKEMTYTTIVDRLKGKYSLANNDITVMLKEFAIKGVRNARNLQTA